MVEISSTPKPILPSDLLNQDAQIANKQTSQAVASGLMSMKSTPTTTPDAATPTPPTSSQTLLASLSAFMSGGSSIDTEVLLIQVAVAMRDVEATTQKSKINTDQEAKKASLEEKQAKLEESAKKMEEAEKKRTSNNIFDKIKLAFEWLGAILAVVTAVIAGALASITGVGVIAAGLMIAGAVTALVMVIDSTVSQATGMGIAGNLAYIDAKSRGLSDTDAKEYAGKADMGFKIAMAIIAVGLAIAGGVASVSSGLQAGANAAKTAVKVGIDSADDVVKIVKDSAMAFKSAFKEAMEEVGQIAGKAAGDAAKMAEMNQLKHFKNLTEMANTANTVGTTGANVASVGMKYEMTQTQAAAKSLQAEAKTDEAMLQMLDDMIDQALTRLMAAGDRFSAMLDAITEGMQDRSSTLSRAKFSA